MTAYSDAYATTPFSARTTALNGSWNFDVTNLCIQQVTVSNANYFAVQNGMPRSTFIDYEFDLYIVSETTGGSGNRRHVGGFMQAVDGSAITGLRVTHLDTGWSLSSWAAGTETARTANITYTLAKTFNIATTYHIRIQYNALTGAGSLWCDGTLHLTWNYVDAAFATGLRPGYHSYGGNHRFDNLTYQSDPDLTGFNLPGVATYPLNASAKALWGKVAGETVTYEYRVNGGSATAGTSPQTISSLTNNALANIEVRVKTGTTTGNWVSAPVTPSATRFTILLDDFARTDSASVVGSPIIGGAYSVGTGTWGLSAGRLYASATTGSSRLIAPGSVDLSATFKMPVFPNSSNSFGFIFRHTDASNFMMIYVASGTFRVWSNVAGTQTLLQDFGAVTVNDILGVICQGAYVYPTLNGRVLVAVPDVRYGSGASQIGVWSSGQNVARLDDIEVYSWPRGITDMGSGDGQVPNIEFPAEYAVGGTMIEDDDVVTAGLPRFNTGWAYLGRDLKTEDEGAA